jgi:hypothetical protein
LYQHHACLIDPSTFQLGNVDAVPATEKRFIFTICFHRPSQNVALVAMDKRYRITTIASLGNQEATTVAVRNYCEELLQYVVCEPLDQTPWSFDYLDTSVVPNIAEVDPTAVSLFLLSKLTRATRYWPVCWIMDPRKIKSVCFPTNEDPSLLIWKEIQYLEQSAQPQCSTPSQSNFA